jgi:hypothetical protein
LLPKPPSGGFPEGLRDRAFTPRLRATDLKGRFNVLKVEGLALEHYRGYFLKHAEALTIKLPAEPGTKALV